MQPELSQPYEPNPLLASLYRRFFQGIEVDPAWVAAVRERAAAGTVVYVLRNLSFLDFFALDHLTKRYQLPQIRFANDLGLWVLEPMGKGWTKAILRSGRPKPEVLLEDALRTGGSAALFLKRPSNVRDRVEGRGVVHRGRSEGDGLLHRLLELQRAQATPIFLVPQVFVWTKRPDTRSASMFDSVLGSSEWPGKLRTSIQFLANYRNVTLRAGEPIHLAEYLAAEQPAADNDDALVRRLTYALLRRLERERRTILGPAQKASDRVREEILRSLKLRSVIRDLAGEGQKEQLVLTLRAYGMLRELQARPAPEVVSGFDHFLDAMVNRIYDGIEIDGPGLERIRDAARKGTLVLLPSHKSHVDYLMLSWVFYRASLQLPLIAAGDNLSFFPLGPLLRRGGGFFIRRSFKGDRLYAAVVDAYIRRLVRDGFTLEFFLEGGRSRTGKLLPPKVGLLNMVVEAALTISGKDVFFVPVSIGYDRLVEGGTYVRELSGAEKQKEDARGLLRTTRIFAGKYGRLNIQFGEILSLRDLRHQAAFPDGSRALVGEASNSPLPPLSPAKRRAMVTRLAHRVMAEINRVTAVTAGSIVATALLNTPRRGLSHGELLEQSRRLMLLLVGLGARISPSLRAEDGHMRDEAIRDAALLFLDAETIVARVPGEAGGESMRKRAKIYTGPDLIYSVPDEKRLSLDLSKNIIVHFFVPRALVASALLAPGEGADAHPARVTRAVLEERVRQLSRIFKFEFMFRADATFEENFAETIREMLASGELAQDPDARITSGPGHDGMTGSAWIDFYASLTRTFLEGYQVAARAISSLLKGPLPQKELTKRSIAMGEKMFLDTEISRREAVSRPLFENAYLAFADQGYIAHSDGKVALCDSFADAKAVLAIEQRVLGFLPSGERRL